jgi:hypothetical protein
MNKYFNVTHVQKALQNHARIGHDVLTDPRTAHIDGKKYGMALGHTLIIQDTNSRNLLTSHVLQDEKPVVSEIRSASTPTEGRHSRGTSAWVPHPQSGFILHDEEGSGHDGFFEENNKSTNGLWLPHPDHANSAVKDIHEHLATHNKIDTTNWHAEGKLSNLNEKMKVFTHPLPVFSGLIDVLHRGEDNKVNKYIYNPDTEQLHKRTDEDSE